MPLVQPSALHRGRAPEQQVPQVGATTCPALTAALGGRYAWGAPDQEFEGFLPLVRWRIIDRKIGFGNFGGLGGHRYDAGRNAGPQPR